MSDYLKNLPLTETVYYILLSLYKPLHGYGIMQKVSELSSGRIDMGAGTLYGAINTLLKKSWIKPVTNNEESRKKIYQISEIGLKVLELEITRLEELLKNGKNILKGELKWNV